MISELRGVSHCHPQFCLSFLNVFEFTFIFVSRCAADGIAGRGPGYGIVTVRVDGNDVLAVSDVVRGARKLAIEEVRAFVVCSCSSVRRVGVWKSLCPL